MGIAIQRVLVAVAQKITFLTFLDAFKLVSLHPIFSFLFHCWSLFLCFHQHKQTLSMTMVRLKLNIWTIIHEPKYYLITLRMPRNSFMFYLIQPKNLWIKLDGSQVFATPSLAFLNDTRWSMCEDFETIYDTYMLSSFYCLYNRIDVDTSSIKLFHWIFGSQQWKSCVGIGNDIPHYIFRKSQTSNSKLW